MAKEKKIYNMKDFDIDKLLKKGEIVSELELEQASQADRKLRLLTQENPNLKLKRVKLRELIYAYEKQHWSVQSKITERQIEESDEAEILADKFETFISKRKKLIKSKLIKLNLNQQEFGRILGHKNKSYISELMNGVSPFSLKDLIVINNLLKINLNSLVFRSIPYQERKQIEKTIIELNKPKLKLELKEFSFA